MPQLNVVCTWQLTVITIALFACFVNIESTNAPQKPRTDRRRDDARKAERVPLKERPINVDTNVDGGKRKDGTGGEHADKGNVKIRKPPDTVKPSQQQYNRHQEHHHRDDGRHRDDRREGRQRDDYRDARQRDNRRYHSSSPDSRKGSGQRDDDAKKIRTSAPPAAAVTTAHRRRDDNKENIYHSSPAVANTNPRPRRSSSVERDRREQGITHREHEKHHRSSKPVADSTKNKRTPILSRSRSKRRLRSQRGTPKPSINVNSPVNLTPRVPELPFYETDYDIPSAQAMRRPSDERIIPEELPDWKEVPKNDAPLPVGFKLVKLIVVARHGHRAPCHPMSIVGVTAETWCYGYGQLTKYGREQMHKLGVKARARYNDLFSGPHNLDDPRLDIRLFSTGVQRSEESATCFVSGFYEPHGYLIPVTRVDLDLLMSNPTISCPRYKQDRNNYKNRVVNKYVDRLYERFKKHLDHLKREHIGNIVDNFLAEVAMGVKNHPDWLKSVINTDIAKFKHTSFSIATWTFTMARLLIGPTLRTIGDLFERTMAGDPQMAKTYYFSGHDTSLHSILNTIKPTNNELRTIFIDFGAGIFFEVYQAADKNGNLEYFVRVVFNADTTLERLLPLSFHECTSTLCTAAEFKSIIRTHSLSSDEEWKKECRNMKEADPITLFYS